MKLLGEQFIATAEGDPSVLGATASGSYVNYAVAVPGAAEVTLHVFEGRAKKPLYSIVLSEEDRYGDIFSVKVADNKPDRTYLYETKGERFLDPYAKLVLGRDHFGKKLTRSERKALRSPVRFHEFSWRQDRHPCIPFSDMLLYKLHVRGFTMQAGVGHKGTYLGVAEKAEYLKELGVNAVLLMPCTEFNEIEEPEINEGIPGFYSSPFYRSSTYKTNEDSDEDTEPVVKPDIPLRVNYWGYADHYFLFAPKASYASNPERADAEFKTMVRKLHSLNIEVLMELNVPAGTNRSMVVDALRFWVREYHLDGFRINPGETDPILLAGDPYLSGTKLLANGWDIGTIYQRDRIPNYITLAEFHDGFRDDARRFLKGDEGMAGTFASRIIRHPDRSAVINYITDHNGFTLCDLYMYDVKHNEQNGENGHDGSNYNYSWNCGAEGPDRRKRIRDLRLKMKKNAMLSMFLSQGVPMILAGDEFGNTQEGNNNAYCQDNPTGWVSWGEARKNAELLAFVKKISALRSEHPVLHNPAALRGTDYLSCGCPDVSIHGKTAWRPDDSPYNRTLGILLGGEFVRKNRDESDDSFYLIFNMYWEEQTFDIPRLSGGRTWKLVLATDPALTPAEITEDRLTVPRRTIAVLQSVKNDGTKKAQRKKAK